MKLFLLYRDKPILWVTGLSDVFKNLPVSSPKKEQRNPAMIKIFVTSEIAYQMGDLHHAIVIMIRWPTAER